MQKALNLVQYLITTKNFIPKGGLASFCINLSLLLYLKTAKSQMNENQKSLEVSSILKHKEERKQRKEQNIRYHELLSQVWDIPLSNKQRVYIKDCGTFLEFLGDQDLEYVKLGSGNFCKNRFCPHCSYNLARKNALELQVLMQYLESLGYSFIFLTLTAPNVTAEELEQELRDYSQSFDRLFKRKEVSSVVNGYTRKLEVTYNRKTDTYHPHYHVLLAVSEKYFSGKYYIPRARWLKLWQECKKDPSITQVDVRKYKDKDTFEITKYIAKDSDYLYNEHVFKTFYLSLKGKRLLSYSGVFKDAAKLYSAGKLDYLLDTDQVEYIYKLYLRWLGVDYDISEPMELTEDEYIKYNKKPIKEIEVD